MSNVTSQPLIVRADASVEVGTGHIMRCLALAQAWQDAGGKAVFLLTLETPWLDTRLQSEGMAIVHLPVEPGSDEDAIHTANLVKQMGATWVVVDGYHFGAVYQRRVKEGGSGVLFIDDIGSADRYCADLILNQNIHAHEGLYTNRAPYTRLLLGSRYVLLRREFLKWRSWKREIPEVACKVLVTLGGSDPNNVSLKAIQALQQVGIDGLEGRVVVGGSNPHYEALKASLRGSQTDIRLEANLADMPELMAWADVGISSGGSTVWELAFMGLPSVILVLAHNQEEVTQMMEEREVFLSVGYGNDAKIEDISRELMNLLLNRDMRYKLSHNCFALVDGLGGARVIEALSELYE